MSSTTPFGAKRLGLAALLAAGMCVPALAGQLFPLNASGMSATDVAMPAPVLVAQNTQQAAQLAVRIQQLEEQIRTLTGQVEGLQFQLTQMQTLLENQTADNEFRFQQLEGGAPGKPQAATESGGAMPAAELPQAPVADVLPGAGDADIPLLPDDEMPMDSLGDSQDPLIGAGGGTAPLALPGGRPLDLTLDGGTPVDGDAAAQYEAGYDAILRGDYAFAEEQFRQFIALYPKDAQAPDATNWLGEALLQRAAYDEAADVLLTGFQNYPNAVRAPDMLLRLGVALAGAGELDTACRTFAEVGKRYPSQPAAFAARLQDEKARAQCPA